MKNLQRESKASVALNTSPVMAAPGHNIQAKPPAIRPSLANRTGSTNGSLGSPSSDVSLDSAISPTNDTGGLLSKTYVIPPRPKPGRKPATDTPQTKRKEQNREAQRAFRERRAARVGELEDELAKKSKAWAEREASLEQALQNQQRAFQREVESLQAQMRDLEQALDDEKRTRSQAEFEIQTLRSKRYSASSMTSLSSGTSTPWRNRPVSPNKPEILDYRTSHPSSRTDAGRQPNNQDAFDPRCGRCTNGGQCACLDQAFARTTNVLPKEDAEPMEIDFTTPSAPTRPKNLSRSGSRPSEYAPHDSSPTDEPCGFCTDTQNCVCRAYQEPSRPAQQTTDNSVKLPRIQAPGTCDRCMEDPERQRFCKMLAQAPPLSSPAATARNANDRLPSIDERMSMSCDQAYDALSQEPSFHDKRNNPSFISQLRARPAAHEDGQTRHGTELVPQSALEVDIASVLAAMRTERKEEERRSHAR